MRKGRSYMQRELKFDSQLKNLLEHLGTLLPDNQHRESFFDYCLRPQPTSFRLNNLLNRSRNVKSIIPETFLSVPWCEEGFVLPDSRKIGHSFEHAIGGIYIQAKAPMLAVNMLNPKPGDRVLDLCAAPGGKSIQIAAYRGKIIVGSIGPSSRTN